MITILTLKMVINLCMGEYRPKVDRDFCANQLIVCIQKLNNFEDCANHYIEAAEFYGDPSEADSSYRKGVK